MARKPNSGVWSSINPQREEATEIRAKLSHGYREPKMIRLRRMVEASRKAQREEHKRMLEREREAQVEIWEAMPKEWKAMSSKDRQAYERQHEESFQRSRAAMLRALQEAEADEKPWNLPDNFLSARTAEIDRRAANGEYIEPDELDLLWRDLRAQFERAVLDGDAAWFERFAKAIRFVDRRSETDKDRDRFDAAVARELEMGFWATRAKSMRIESATPTFWETRPKSKRRESATLTPAGKRVNFTEPQQVLDKLGVETVPPRQKKIEGSKGDFLDQSARKEVRVCGCRFASERRAREAVEVIRKRLGYEWKKVSRRIANP